MQVIESLQEFIARQRCDHVRIDRGTGFRSGEPVGQHVFRNGAVSTGTVHYDPSPDPVERARIKRQYLAEKIKRETADLMKYRHDCLEAAFPPEPEEVMRTVVAAKARIAELQAENAELDELLRPNPTEAELAERRRRQAEADQQRVVSERKDAVRAVFAEVEIPGYVEGLRAEAIQKHEEQQEEQAAAAKVEQQGFQNFLRGLHGGPPRMGVFGK